MGGGEPGEDKYFPRFVWNLKRYEERETFAYYVEHSIHYTYYLYSCVYRRETQYFDENVTKENDIKRA